MAHHDSSIIGKLVQWIETHTTAVYSILLILLGSVVYGFQYWQPNNTQWDEVYYIPVVARYETGTFFMESHPPLGKLLITAGDVLFNANKNIDKTSIIQYDTINNSDEIKVNDLPQGYNFVGIRFFPVIAAILIPLVVMAIVTLVTKKDWLGFAVGMVVVLDTALALHFRAAMLDSILILLMLCSIFFALRGVVEYLERKRIANSTFVWTAIFAGLSLSTKYNAVIVLIPLFIICLLQAQPLVTKNKTWFVFIDRALYRVAGAWTRFVILLTVVATVFIAVWGIHFTIARNYNPLLANNQGLFLSSEYLAEQLKAKGSVQDIRMLANAIASGVRFTLSYHASVPSFEACERESKAKNEVCNGSLPWMWVIGARTINFRYSKWAQEKNGQNSMPLDRYAALQRGEDPDVKNEAESEKNARASERKVMADAYTPSGIWFTLIGNPFVWLLSLVGVVFGTWLLMRTLWNWIQKRRQRISSVLASILILSTVWLGYMIIALQSTRILYLYHYFFTLVIGIILCGLTVAHYKLDEARRFQGGLALVLSTVILGFLFFAPFAYGIPMTYDEFDWRNWLVAWAVKK